MVIRGRVSTTASSQGDLQIWQSICSQLKSLENARNSSISAYKRLERTRAESPSKNLEGIYNVVENCILDEQRAIGGAMEQLNILIALRQAPNDLANDVRRRKRKADDTMDVSVERANDAKIQVTPENRRLRRSSSTQMRRDSDGEVRPTVQPAAVALQRGRKVAFRQPQRSDGRIVEEGDVWIMATVVSSVNNDPRRYIVQDAEDEGTSGPTYNTTLKSIAPLPNSLETLPMDNYQPGSRVLALYPDTSCFYNATIQGGGPALSASIPRARQQKREKDLLHAPYQVMFDDDGADIKLVPAYLVVEPPTDD
ncbi:hypothetical protein MPSI1_001593 [Malassezia psittaci]|uniref:SGF29 C-terminal domain-containing protein n=1 Tax=Malassezia psittaci TaxID=1821823 RepID=A0AAF0JDF7_9BASI|nr:hypothetical protein MPSI1_001593 [Malassezia psittaci]